MSLVGPIEKLMSEDHARLDRLLRAAERDDGSIDSASYAELRHDLLRHIAMEEKVLLPFARERRGGSPLPIANRLRVEHGGIAKLLVRSPTREIIDALRAALAGHNAIEEGPEGLYAQCDALGEGDEIAAVVDRLRGYPKVPLAPYYDGPLHSRGR